MHIPSYQVNNVIKIYSRQISQNRVAERQKSMGGVDTAPVDKINISQEGKRQTIINKVSEEILERITKYGPRDETEQEIVDRLNSEMKQKAGINHKKDSRFVFNFIGENNQKVTNTLSVEDSKLVSKRLEELVKETVDKNMES